ncbi:hypothetical protein [Falsiroseomonas selenitidurans]|uniref:Uncharacterized protein n=1 Tax=Falsiroseomonas selenitidurans TaxID=2716335 RepID=A0ABX1EAC1_9PROT|nr:hypothetical protein [Falsiroseomonas selenitidurans]NKC33903.1 hypothetical protein [Falsiroseomonas selenitidurans]
MSRTLVLAEWPFRDLRSRALLAGLPEALGEAAPLWLATAAPQAPPGFAPVAPTVEVAKLGATRVVLAGVFQDRALLDQALALAGRAMAAGARLELRRFGVERGAAQRTPPAEVALLDRAVLLELRDHHTANALLVWRVAPAFRIAPYPERDGPGDPALLAGLPSGPLLGLSILGGASLQAAWSAWLPELRRALAPMRGWPVLPLPMEHPGAPMDDLPGTSAFLEAVLPGAALLLPDLADPVWRRRQLTPARMKALVARCRAVVTNQDLPAAYAVAGGVKVIGLALGQDRRAVTCITQLANDLPPGSALLHRPTG